MRIWVTCTALKSVVYTKIKHQGKDKFLFGIFALGEMAHTQCSVPCFNTDNPVGGPHCLTVLIDHHCPSTRA